MKPKKPDTDLTRPLSPSVSRLLTPVEVAQMLGISITTLAVWRCRRRYRLPYVKIGSRVMYRLQAVEDFLCERDRGGAVEE